MAIPNQRISLEEFLALPEEEPALEYEDGVVTQKVPPQGKHAALQLAICEMLNRLMVPEKLAKALPELRTTYASTSRVPDVAVYRWERIPRDSSGRVADDFREPPDIAIEIASPGQSVNQLVSRCLWYVGHGVPVALLIDPYHESVVVLALIRFRWPSRVQTKSCSMRSSPAWCCGSMRFSTRSSYRFG